MRLLNLVGWIDLKAIFNFEIKLYGYLYFGQLLSKFMLYTSSSPNTSMALLLSLSWLQLTYRVTSNINTKMKLESNSECKGFGIQFVLVFITCNLALKKLSLQSFDILFPLSHTSPCAHIELCQLMCLYTPNKISFGMTSDKSEKRLHKLIYLMYHIGKKYSIINFFFLSCYFFFLCSWIRMKQSIDLLIILLSLSSVKRNIFLIKFKVFIYLFIMY